MPGLKAWLAEALRGLARRAARRGSHCTPEELLALSDRTLTGRAEARALTHLASCEACSRLVLDARQFPSIPLRAPELLRTASEEDEDWAAIQARIRRSEEPAQRGASAKGAARVQLSGRRSAYAVPLAATLLLGCVVLSYLLVSKSRSALKAPGLHANVAFVSVPPLGESALRAISPETTLSIDGRTERVVLILATRDFRSFSDYEVEVFRGRTLLWRRRGLARAPDGSFSLELARDEVPSGSYRISVSGIATDRKEALGAYSLRVVTPQVR